MYTLPAPARNHIADYTGCAAFRRRRATRQLLQDALGSVSAAYQGYIQNLGNAGVVHPIAGSDSLKRAWKTNYNLLSELGPMSAMRGDLMAAAKNALCPLCGRDQVGTLDHYLPKSRYPELSVLGANLVPACEICNRLKGNKFGTTPDKQLLHFYWHALPDVELLKARIVIRRTVEVKFNIARHPNVPADTFERLKYHFRVLKLAKYFSREANLELSDRREALRLRYHPNNDFHAVRTYLDIEAQSVRGSRGINNWKTALLLALFRDDAFCNGGLMLL